VNILAFDTCTFTGSVAVVSNGILLAESTARMAGTHSEQLISLVDEVLRRSTLTLDDIQRLGVGIGPGSFTGVRIGVATAKGLHLARGIPLYGVCSLDALAATAWNTQGFLVAALDARRGEVFAALYHVENNVRTVVIPPFHGTPERVGSVITASSNGPIACVSDLDDEVYKRTVSSDPERFARAPLSLGSPMARMIAHEVFAGRGTLDDGTLEPMYVRASDAKPSVLKAP
jgi:tRNA threonylcarbamoyl adenosine modification protein YeaZ